MKRLTCVLLIALMGALFLAVPAGAGPYSGLWVGTATLKYVSEVNKQYADLSFDLGLMGVRAHDSLISQGAAWKYNDTGSDPGAEWMNPGYDDTVWDSGPAPLGVGHGDIVTTISDQTTTYFRRSFNVVDPSFYSGLRLRLWRDDGIAVYLNGEEIFRNNMPTGPIQSSDLALSEITEDTPTEFTMPASLLQTGPNVIAAELHTASGTDDLLFDMTFTASFKEQLATNLISMEADGWNYSYTVTEPTPSWQEVGYNDSDWFTGQGQFGFGEGDENRAVSESTPTVYFRRKFTSSGNSDTHLRLLLLRDDGAIVYVNGIEVLRSNMPPGDIEHNTSPLKAIGSLDEGRYLVVDIELAEIEGLALQDGADANVVAVELHQHPAELGGSTGGGEPALTRTSAPLDLRLMFHVDAGGTVRLLKEVIQMYDSNTNRYVLLTDHTLVPNYTGVAARDGVPVGRRLSAVGFDFVGTSKECGSGFSPNGTLGCTFTLTSGHPTNPFLHRYHPDHDNMDERYENEVEEAYEITRAITLNFSDRYPSDEDLPERGVKPAGWGLSQLGGIYTEIITGIYKDDITVRGPFNLNRVVTTDTLTP